jgi:hypothetical protein
MGVALHYCNGASVLTPHQQICRHRQPHLFIRREATYRIGSCSLGELLLLLPAQLATNKKGQSHNKQEKVFENKMWDV